MKGQIYQEVKLTIINLNPLNPRRNFSGPKFDELVKSIREKGVIEPILLRNKNNGNYEIVAGERRFRALSQIARESTSLDEYTIPAMIRELTDDNAFEIMTIENLQREDLTELEEAQSFKAYLDRKGDDSLSELAERTGINPKYIRRRISILNLPKNILKSWDKGELKYGHLEQLSRLSDKKDILQYFKEILEWKNMSVKGLKEKIDGKSPELKQAKFDLKKTGCLTCMQNSDVQKILFGDISDLGKTHCLNPKCFKQNQNNYLQAHWDKSKYKKKYETNGFRFYGDIAWNEYETFYDRGKILKKCRDCPDFVTLLYITGSVYSEMICIGDRNCFNQQTKSTTSSTSKSVDNKKSWHGEFFREQFYTEQIPLKLADTKPNDEKIHRLSLLTLLYSNRDIGSWFSRTYMETKKNTYDDYHYSSLDQKWQYIENLSDDEVQGILKEAAIQITLQYGFGPKTRHIIGSYLGFDLGRDWLITEEYLTKKTIKEMLTIGEKFKIFSDKKAQKFLYEVLLKKRGKFTNCKKSELIRVFMESGIDLAGKVPQEILAINQKQGR